MKKKVFSLMMTLLLAATGFVRADELTVHDGSATNGNVPVYGFYADAYNRCEMIYPAAELSAMNGGSISSLKFYATQENVNWGAASFQVYVSEVADATFSGTTFVGNGTDVYQGALSIVGNQMVVTFTTPYTYNGGNLLIGIAQTVKGSYISSTWNGETVNGASLSNYNYNGLSQIASGTQRDFLPKTTFTYTSGTGGGGGGGIALEDDLHIKYVDATGTEVIDQLDLGVRPIGAWMEPFEFTMYSEGPTYTVTVLDFTPSDGMFTVEGEELPFQVTSTQDVDLTLATNATVAGVIERQFVAITEGDRAAHIWPVVVEMYAPEVPDVVEKAYGFGNVNHTFSYVGIPANITPTTLHDDYTLPFPEIPEGVDGVYKMTFTEDVMLNAYVSAGENGKVALYTEDFYGEGGPMAHNYYQGPSIGAGGGGGGTGGAFEAMIGNDASTTTLNYFPFHTLWKYSIAENLFLASELIEAGVTTAPMTSLSWNVVSTSCTTPQTGISIWMANVSDSELTSTSHLTSGMTLVYTGENVLPTAGWNEYEFNVSNFAWDGHSNVLIVCQRLNGAYQGMVSWQTHNPGFVAACYDFDDYEVYNMATQTYSMYTSPTNRANIIMKGGTRGARDAFAYDFEGGLNGWNVLNVNAGEGEWIHSDANLGGYDYTMNAHGGTGFAMSYSFVDYVGDFNTNSYLVSPQSYNISNGASLNFFYDYANDDYPDFFEVCVATTAGAPTAADFTSVWSVGAKGARGARGTNGVRRTSDRYADWREVTVDLSAYEGQEVWIAFHHEDYDMYEVWIDDVTVNTGVGGGGGTPFIGGDAMAYGPVIEDAAIEAGTYYLVASSTTPDFEVTINAEAMPCPAVDGFAFNPTPADDADGIEPASVTLRWMVPAYATGWRLIFGSTYHPEPTHPQTVMYPEDGSFSNELANSYTVTNLWNNTNYFWRVEFNNDGCEEGVSSPVWGFTTHLNIPTNLQASDYTIFDDETVTLTWNAVVDRTYRQYNIYRDGVCIANTTVNDISATSYTDGPLPYNMAGYTYYVTAVYDEGESAPSDPVVVKVSGYTNATGINGYAWEQDGTTGIPGVLVTLTGTDEFGDPHVYTATTDANGYYNKRVYAGEYTNAVATKDGYQETVTVHPLPFTAPYNGQVDDVNFIIDELFNAPCAVIAEYYPDSLDPESPYVKVYWGCGLPSAGNEIVEPFETGDFSLFDWQIDANYPWSITTTNPYEGTYCMKSGGAGVANVVSNMTVTVNIPADGEMSFFSKISCESSWDYGYFFIDGVQKGQYTGAGNWGERKFPITAGDHTFQWRYTKDSSLNQNDDCFYVDYITFYRQPEPVVPGWAYYDDGVNADAVGLTAGGSFYWGVMFPVGGYAGTTLTKVSMYDYSAHTGNIMVYQGGATAPATLIHTQAYTCTGSEDFMEVTMTAPVAVDPSQNLWIVLNNDNGQYVAAACENTGDPNGRWISLDGATWEDVASYGLEYTWMIRAYVAGGAKGGYYAPMAQSVEPVAATPRVRVKGEPVNTVFAVSGNSTKHDVGVPAMSGSRALDHYRVYRTNCYNDGPYTEENTVLLATVWVPDTVYIDVEWAELPAGVYKWGVGAVYSGNRGEMTESEIAWAAPVNVNRTSGNFASASGNTGSMAESVGLTNRDNWYAYDNGNNVDAIGLGGSNFWWAIMLPAGSYTENTLTKTATYDYMAMTGDVTIYNDGAAAPAGDALAQASVTLTGTGEFVETVFDSPVTIDPSKNLWIVYYNGSGATYPAAVCNNTGDANGRWVSIDGATWEDLAGYSLDYTFMLRAYLEDNGTPGPGPMPSTNLNELALPRESETIWSNCLDKDMYIIADETTDGVTVNVLLNSADSPEGVKVTFTNYNEAEQEMYPIDQIILDETGFYAFESFRKGEYKINVDFDGYEPIEDSVSIWDPMDLRYVMIEIIYGVNDLYVSSTGWAMWESESMPGGITPPVPPTPGTTSFTEDFEGGLNGWNVLNVNVDGGEWIHSSGNLGGYDYTTHAHSGTGFAMCYSFVDYVGEFNTNSYMYTPQKYSIVNGSTLTFWADNANDSYPENFSVCVATADNPTAADFTQVWSGGAKGNGGAKANVRRDANRYDNWRLHTIDLSAYAGQDVYIAFHDVNYDMYEIWIDDVELSTGAKNGDRHLEYFKVMCESLDHEPIFNANTEHNFCQVATEQLVPGEYYICKVAAVYSTGMSAWSECVWQYIPCTQYAGTVDGIEVNGSSISWVYPGGITPPVPPTPGTTSFTEDFEGGLNGWNVLTVNVDGGEWIHSSGNLGGYDYTTHAHSGTGFAMCYSFVDYVGEFNTNSYMYTPQKYSIVNGSTLTFWADNANDSYPENFSVCVATADNPTAADFTQVWSGGAKGNGGAKANVRRDANRYDNWRLHTIDLSAYAGQDVYIAFHDVNYDMYEIWIDDVELSTGAKGMSADGDILGAMIFVDGEWEAFVQYPTATYTYEGEGEEVCVRMVYDGTNTLPEGNIYFSMSCPECEPLEPGIGSCEPGAPIHAELMPGNDDIKVWWGVPPAAPISEWLYYDDGVYATSVGLGDASSTVYWATMFPAASLAPYAGTNLTKVAVFTFAGTYNNPMTVTIYLGGTTAPATAYSTTTFTPTVDEDFEEVTLDPVAIDGTQNLWIVCSQMGAYPAQACADTGDANNRWVSLDGTSWQDLASAGLPGYGWLLRGYVTNQGKGMVENVAIEVEHPANVATAGMTLGHTEVVSIPAPMAFMHRASIVKYNVYRSTAANGTYSLIGEVAETGATYYEYIDSPAVAGTYYYQVRAEYDNGCESDPAVAAEEPSVNYVSATTDGVGENGSNVALYPNPTKGNVTIEAEGMSRITVVSVLGQVVFDTELKADEYTLNMGQFNAGMYMVRVYTESGMVVKRVTVMQ